MLSANAFRENRKQYMADDAWPNQIFKGNYMTRFANYILNCNFLTNSLKFIKVYIIRKGISQVRQWWCRFFTKTHYFGENRKKLIFAMFLQNKLEKKIEIWKVSFETF